MAVCGSVCVWLCGCVAVGVDLHADRSTIFTANDLHRKHTSFMLLFTERGKFSRNLESEIQRKARSETKGPRIAKIIEHLFSIETCSISLSRPHLSRLSLHWGDREVFIVPHLLPLQLPQWVVQYKNAETRPTRG